jgi:hypothetical protein
LALDVHRLEGDIIVELFEGGVAHVGEKIVCVEATLCEVFTQHPVEMWGFHKESKPDYSTKENLH